MNSNEIQKKKVSKKVPVFAVGGVALTSALVFNPTTSVFANESQDGAMAEISQMSALPCVGQGIEWPTQVNAPFVDMADWVAWGTAYSNNGAPNLGRMAENSGAEFFKLGFVQATTGQVRNGRVEWGWGGHPTLSPANPSDQYRGIRQSIRDVREMGGDVAVSLGGLDGITFWEVTHDVEILANTYRDLINEYGLTRLDLDIETGDTNWGTGSLERNGNIANAQALRKIQEETGIEIVLTLPALPTGLLSGRGLEMLEIYLSNGVDITMVNIMTMYFGSTTFLPGECYAAASIRSAEATKRQIQDAYRRFAGIELTDAEAFKKVGVTPSIGMSDRNFTLADAEKLVDFAIENGLGMTSFWAMNRDAMIGWDANHLSRHLGITTPYQFSSIFNRFMEDVERPEVTPEEPEVTPEEPEVTPEEPEVTPEEPEVTPEEPEVTPEEPEVTPEEPEVTPEEPEVTPEDAELFDPTRIYLAGDIVFYQGNLYRALWWTQGGSPSTSQAWEVIITPHEDGSVDFRLASAYVGGDIVRFEGRLYRARWWTQGVTPTNSAAWEFIGYV